MEERDKDIITQNQAEDEIDLVEIIQKIWRNRRFILKVTAIFAVLGFIVAISTPNVYTASCTLVPQTGQKSTGSSLGGLAAMAGINLGNLNTGEVLSPSVYPKIMTNINFQKELIYSKYHCKELSDPITLYDYYTEKENKKFSLFRTLKKYTIGLPGIIYSAIKSEHKDNILFDNLLFQSFTSEERNVVKIVNSNISISVNNKDGYVSIYSSMPEPLLAAELAQKGQELLQKYITEFKIEKVKSNLRFVESSYEESKKFFESKQAELARFRDSNKSLTTAIAKTQEEKLTSEYNLLLNIYSELAKQKEQAKIAVTETTPIFTIIEPVIVPTEKSKPSRLMILLVYSFIGIIIGMGVVILVGYFEEKFTTNINKYWFIPNIV